MKFGHAVVKDLASRLHFIRIGISGRDHGMMGKLIVCCELPRLKVKSINVSSPCPLLDAVFASSLAVSITRSA